MSVPTAQNPACHLPTRVDSPGSLWELDERVKVGKLQDMSRKEYRLARRLDIRVCQQQFDCNAIGGFPCVGSLLSSIPASLV